jgi:cellobiose epimerase
MNDQIHSFLVDKSWKALPTELEIELGQILHYWEAFATDRQHGGFHGRIDQDNTVYENSPRGSVLNARILWTFSAAYNLFHNPAYLDLATRAYQYIVTFLTDHEYGGMYWSVDHKGNMLETHKQVYAQAFGIYGMSEYYRASKNSDALKQALTLYSLIERYSRDLVYGGYVDAFARDWTFLDDKRLSPKDENASKTMNTHLHLVEAYANLYVISRDANLRNDIRELLQIFDEKMIIQASHHLALYFSDDWKMDERIISYGHDIEAGWLLQSCAESIGDPESITRSRKNAVLITEAAMEGLDEDGGLWYEYDNHKKKLTHEKHWWPQAEALIGFCNAWQLTGNVRYKEALLQNWHFIQNHILDTVRGEWFWGIDQHSNKMKGQDKVGIWKCPYHNSRACLELLKRLKT